MCFVHIPHGRMSFIFSLSVLVKYALSKQFRYFQFIIICLFVLEHIILCVM